MGDLTYEAFKFEYLRLFKMLMSYSSDQAGSYYYAEELGNLVDAYPEFEERLEKEVELDHV